MPDEGLLISSVVGVELILLGISIRKNRIIPVPTGVLAYIIFYQLVFYFVHHGDIESYVMMTYSLGGIDSRLQFTVGSYFLIFLFFFVFGYRLRLPTNSGADNAALERFVAQHLPKVNFFGSLSLTIYVVVFCLGLNWSVAWSNTTYLAMTDPAQALSMQSAPFRLVLSLLLPAGLVTSSLSALNFSLAQYRHGVFFGCIWLAICVYYLGAHQRGAVLVPGIFAMTYALLAGRPRKLLVFGAVLLAIVAYPSSLIGRLAPPQGLSSIPGTFSSMAEIDAATSFGEGISNLAEGIFIFCESSLLQGEFPQNYKILSLSPFPSAIDGFDKIQSDAQIRLNEYTPMSGYIEALKFGPMFVAGIGFYFIIAMRLNSAIATRNRLAFILVNLFIFLAFFVLGAYPLRNGERFLLIAIGFSCVVLYWTRRRPDNFSLNGKQASMSET